MQSTLEQNLAVIEAFEGQVELCLVNFIKDEEGENIHRWINSLGERSFFNYRTSRSLKHWHAPTAKNAAHSLAQGELVINLDGDNFISKEVLSQLIDIVDNQSTPLLFSGFTGGLNIEQLLIKKLKTKIRGIANGFKNRNLPTKKDPWILRSVRQQPDIDRNGTYGHIGMSKSLFQMIGGYDQSFPSMAAHDKDLLWRAYNIKDVTFIHIPQPRDLLPIENDKVDSLANTKEKDQQWSMMARRGNKQAIKSILERSIVANGKKPIGIDLETN